MEHIESLFARRKRPMPERNRIQAMFPAGSEEIFNPQGTAPGIDLEFRSRRQPTQSRLCAAGSTRGNETDVQRHRRRNGFWHNRAARPRIRHVVMKFFGCGESDMEHRLGEMISRTAILGSASRSAAATISLRITASGETRMTPAMR